MKKLMKDTRIQKIKDVVLDYNIFQGGDIEIVFDQSIHYFDLKVAKKHPKHPEHFMIFDCIPRTVTSTCFLCSKNVVTEYSWFTCFSCTYVMCTHCWSKEKTIAEDNSIYLPSLNYDVNENIFVLVNTKWEIGTIESVVGNQIEFKTKVDQYVNTKATMDTPLIKKTCDIFTPPNLYDTVTQPFYKGKLLDFEVGEYLYAPEGRKAIDCKVIATSKYYVTVEINMYEQEKYTFQQDLFCASNLKSKKDVKQRGPNDYEIGDIVDFSIGDQRVYKAVVTKVENRGFLSHVNKDNIVITANVNFDYNIIQKMEVMLAYQPNMIKKRDF